jgi:hypothetical protein
MSPGVLPRATQPGVGAGDDNASQHTLIFTSFRPPHPPFPLVQCRSFVRQLSLAATTAFPAQPQCRLVLSSAAVRPMPAAPSVNPQGSHRPSTVPVSFSTSAASAPTPTPFVPFAYGSEPIRGVNLYVQFNARVAPTHLPGRHLSDILPAVEDGLFSR